MRWGGCCVEWGEDFEARYHYRPWLVETFVEPEHDGISFKAANELGGAPLGDKHFEHRRVHAPQSVNDSGPGAKARRE